MDEDVFEKKTLKTYSRSKNKKENQNDAVFCEKAMENLKENLSISNSDDKKPKFVNGRRKRGQNKGLASSPGQLKKPKQGRTRKSILQVKMQKKLSVATLSSVHDSFKDDTLFGEGLQHVKKRRQSRNRKFEASTSKQRGRLKKNSTSQTMSEEQSKPCLPKNNISGNILGKANENSANQTYSTLEKVMSRSINVEGLPTGKQVRAEDKVSDWLAKSEECYVSEQDTSKEVFRGAQNITGDEIRCKLFPKEFFDNLNCVLEKRPSAQASSIVKADTSENERKNLEQYARQKEFLSQLALKSGNKQQHYLPSVVNTEKLQRVGDIDDEDLVFMCGSSQSEIHTDTHTETGTVTTTGMGTSKFVESQSDVQTGTATLMTTGKFTETNTGTQIETGTCTQMKTGTSTFSAETGTSRFTETQSVSHTGSGSQFVTDPKVQKYLCSTMRRSASLSKVDFPSELSAVTDSLRNQQTEEKTPKKAEEDFKVPGSPTKCAAFKGVRKGTLQPKNSTELFTTGFVEIIDAIPQMSTIVCDNKSEVTVIDNDYKQPSCDPQPRRQNIKTSTPNKVDTQGQAFEFEIDISSVNLDSGDEDLLHFNESKEVNSEECIQLSTTLIDDKRDDNGMHDTLKEIESKKTDVKVMSPIAAYKAGIGPNKMELAPLDSMIMKDSPKANNKRNLKRQPQPVNVESKVLNKRSHKSQLLKSRVLEKSVRRRSYSRLERLSSQTGFKRRSSRISTRSCMAKNCLSDADKRNVNKGKKVQNVSSSLKCQLDITVKDVYDINNSVIDKSNVFNVNQDSSLDNDVFDIEESAINVPDVETQKLARKKYCGMKKPARKKGPFVKRKSFKRTSSEVFFSPKGLLCFNSSLSSRSLDCLFFKQTHGSTGKHVLTEVTKPLNRNGMAVCTLMNENFTCPRQKISLTRFKSADTRSYQEILNTVSIDNI